MTAADFQKTIDEVTKLEMLARSGEAVTTLDVLVALRRVLQFIRPYYPPFGKSSQEATGPDKLISEQYTEIFAKLNGSALFGQKVDTNSVRDLVVCAYHLGKNEELEKHVGRIEQLNNRLVGLWNMI